MPLVEQIDAARLPQAVAVHCDAFYDYPTMRFVLGAGSEHYNARLAALIGYFLDFTQLKGGVSLAMAEDGELIAAANAVFSGAPEPASLRQRRDSLWRLLGDGARRRYEAYGAATRPFAPAGRHLYLSMLGVRRRCAGRGLARPPARAGPGPFPR